MYTNYNTDSGLELVINTETNLAYCSQSAAARMLNVDETTIRRAVKGSAQIEVKTAKIQTQGGLQGSALLSAEDLGKLAMQYNPELALAMLSAGSNVYLLGLAGYQINAQNPVQVETSALSKLQILQMALESEQKLVSAQAKIEADKGKVLLAENIEVTTGYLSVGAYGKLFGIGRTTYFKILREQKIIMETSTLPYQQYIDSGYFEVTEKIHNNVAYPSTLITGKGQTWLSKKMQEYQDKHS